MTRKPTLVPSLLVLVLGSGCELAGPLIVAAASGEDDGVDRSTASLSVVVDDASGVIGGRTLAPEMFVASGIRVGSDVSIDVVTPEGDLMIQMQVGANTSSTNPYTGFDGTGGFGDEPRGGIGPTGTIAGSSANLMLCAGDFCRAADDFGVELIQTEEGRLAFADGVWGSTESAVLSLRYSED